MKIKNENVAILEMRSHAAWYIKGMPNAQTIKNEIFKAKTSTELKKILDNYLKDIKNVI